MPYAPPRPCTRPGCPALVAGGGRCTEHAAERHRAIDARRGTSHSRGYDADWRAVRAAVLASEPLCRLCAAEGRATAAAVVDHIVTIAEAPERRLDRTNLRPLCKACHDARTMRDQVGPRRRQ